VAGGVHLNAATHGAVHLHTDAHATEHVTNPLAAIVWPVGSMRRSAHHRGNIGRLGDTVPLACPFERHATGATGNTRQCSMNGQVSVLPRQAEPAYAIFQTGAA
jgi:hypothetical protein